MLAIKNSPVCRALGNVSAFAPDKASFKEHWSFSPTLNALRLLNIIALSQSVLSTQGKYLFFTKVFLYKLN